MNLLVPFAIALLALSAPAAAQVCSGLSTFDESKCLTSAYKKADAELRGTISAMLTRVKSRSNDEPSPYCDRECLLQESKQLSAAITASDRGWRQTVDAECGVLVAKHYANGGVYSGEMQCRLSMIVARKLAIANSEAFEGL